MASNASIAAVDRDYTVNERRRQVSARGLSGPCARWIAHGSAFLTLVAGNGTPASTIGRVWQCLARMLILAMTPMLIIQEELWPCSGKHPCNSPSALLFAVPMFFGMFAVIIIGIRVEYQKNIRMIQHARSVCYSLEAGGGGSVSSGARSFIDGRITTLRAVVALLLVLMTIGSSIPLGVSNTFGRLLNDRGLKERGLLVPVVVLSRASFVGFMALTAAAFDAIINAGMWLGTVRYMIKQFTAEVCEVARGCAGVDLEAGVTNKNVYANGFTSSSDNIDNNNTNENTINKGEQHASGDSQNKDLDDFVDNTKVQKQTPSFPHSDYRHSNRRSVAEARITHAFENAWNISSATNDLFAMPLSCIFLVFLSLAAIGWWMVFKFGTKGTVVFAIRPSAPVFAAVCTAISILLLMWASTAGDAWWHARDTLLRPDISLRLSKVIGHQEQKVFARSLERTQLGLDIVNVPVTTNKVLYVIFSLLIFAAYIIRDPTAGPM